MESKEIKGSSETLSNLTQPQEATSQVSITTEKIMQALDLLNLPKGTTVTINLQASSSIVR